MITRTLVVKIPAQLLSGQDENGRLTLGMEVITSPAVDGILTDLHDKLRDEVGPLLAQEVTDAASTRLTRAAIAQMVEVVS